MDNWVDDNAEESFDTTRYGPVREEVAFRLATLQDLGIGLDPLNAVTPVLTWAEMSVQNWSLRC